jgi:AcrR family transcriptional regulator
MKTRDKIIQAALQLFNEEGERNISTNHIAAHLGMSPGNLYYHFQNKQEIIREIFAGYAADLLEQFAPLHGEQGDLHQFNHYLDAIFTLMWNYRFLYSSLPQILQQDEQLHRQYMRVQEQSKGNLLDIFKNLIKLKLITIAESEVETVLTSLHLIISIWLSYQAAISLKSDIDEQVIHQGMLQMTAMIKPFATPLGKKQLLELEDELKQGKTAYRSPSETKMNKELKLRISVGFKNTELGFMRIKRNLGIAGLNNSEAECYLKQVILQTPLEDIESMGKNHYFSNKKFNAILTINAHSFTVITAKKINKKTDCLGNPSLSLK